jgi:hypothetical protein
MNERVDLKNVVENGELKICSPAKAKAKGVFPNRIGWVADNPKVAGIVVFKSQNGDDYPRSQASLNVLRAAFLQGLQEAGWAVGRNHTSDCAILRLTDKEFS